MCIRDSYNAVANEHIIVLDANIDLTGITGFNSKSGDIAIFGKGFTISNYTDSQPMFNSVTKAFLCETKFQNIEVTATGDTSAAPFGSLFHSSRVSAYDVEFKQIKVNIPAVQSNSTTIGGIVGTCVTTTFRDVKVDDLKITHQGSSGGRLGGLCGQLHVNFGEFEGVFDSSFKNMHLFSLSSEGHLSLIHI